MGCTVKLIDRRENLLVSPQKHDLARGGGRNQEVAAGELFRRYTLL